MCDSAKTQMTCKMRRPRHHPLVSPPPPPLTLLGATAPSHLPTLYWLLLGIFSLSPSPFRPAASNTHVGDGGRPGGDPPPAARTRHVMHVSMFMYRDQVSLSLLLPRPSHPFWEEALAFFDPILLSSFLLCRSAEKRFDLSRPSCLSTPTHPHLSTPRHRTGVAGRSRSLVSTFFPASPADSPLDAPENRPAWTCVPKRYQVTYPLVSRLLAKPGGLFTRANVTRTNLRREPFLLLRYTNVAVQQP